MLDMQLAVLDRDKTFIQTLLNTVKAVILGEDENGRSYSVKFRLPEAELSNYNRLLIRQGKH